MGDIIDISEFRKRNDKKDIISNTIDNQAEYYKNRFIQKYLFVWQNIVSISRICSLKMPGNILYKVLESLLLEDKEIPLTHGYRLLQEIINSNEYEGTTDMNVNFYNLVLGLRDYIYDEANNSINRNYKIYIIERYLLLNSMIFDETSNYDYQKHIREINDLGVLNNEFINHALEFRFNEVEINSIKRKVLKYENQRY